MNERFHFLLRLLVLHDFCGTAAAARFLLDLTVIRNFTDGVDIASDREIRRIKSNGVKDLRSEVKCHDHRHVASDN